MLINTPDLNLLGGVSNHYLGLRDFWTFQVKYNTIGKRFMIPGLVILPYDIVKFTLKCILNKPNVVLLNPSLGRKAIKRDAIFLNISRLFKIKTIVFIHGWNSSTALGYDVTPEKFLNMYKKANGFLVLADEFKLKLREWGISAPIHLTSTKVDDKLLSDFNIEDKPANTNILFLSRIEKQKGVFIVIDSFISLKKIYPELCLTIAGDGSALSDAMSYAQKSGVLDISFTGRISGEELKSAFRENCIYLFPTSHGEGMPTSILEAMAFGQAIITTPVGGINDFFIEDKMGYLISSYSHSDYVNKMVHLIQNKNVLRKMQLFNYEYAKTNFMASRVAIQIEKIIDIIIKGEKSSELI